MSEYIAVDVEQDDDPDVMRLITNLALAPDGPESYPDRESGESGSPLAQILFEIEGLAALDIAGKTLIARRTPETEWPALIDDITSALKEFFL
jgi:hypothetical protein